MSESAFSTTFQWLSYVGSGSMTLEVYHRQVTSPSIPAGSVSICGQWSADLGLQSVEHDRAGLVDVSDDDDNVPSA